MHHFDEGLSLPSSFRNDFYLEALNAAVKKQFD